MELHYFCCYSFLSSPSKCVSFISACCLVLLNVSNRPGNVCSPCDLWTVGLNYFASCQQRSSSHEFHEQFDTKLYDTKTKFMQIFSVTHFCAVSVSPQARNISHNDIFPFKIVFTVQDSELSQMASVYLNLKLSHTTHIHKHHGSMNQQRSSLRSATCITHIRLGI